MVLDRLRTILILLSALVAPGAMHGQELLSPVRSADLHLNLQVQAHRLGAFSESADATTLFVLGPGANRLAGAQVLTESRTSGGVRAVPIGAYDGQALATGGDCIFVVDRNNDRNSPVGHLIDSRTGESSQFPIIRGVYSVTFDEDAGRLALLGIDQTGPDAGSKIAVYDCKSKASLGSIHNAIYPAAALLSFAGPDELLLIERSTLTVTPITIASGGLSAGTPVRLTGSEVDDSISRSKAIRLPPNTRPWLIFGHIPGQNGNQFFFLAPYRATEGLRLVEFNDEGTQIASYRVRAESEAATKALSITPFLMTVSAQTFDLLGNDGLIRTFRRPQ